MKSVVRREGTSFAAPIILSDLSAGDQDVSVGIQDLDIGATRKDPIQLQEVADVKPTMIHPDLQVSGLILFHKQICEGLTFWI